ncbi:2Fe-2S iron-sulfur cluster-binding domain / adenylate/guanylate cyclase catalytic domain / peroxidase multi-domain protein [Leptospira ryugenii]|uniref:2Fe-2S iron-sulfur cluster-binding domain / adenylate/guanylate cyclase catalytic domain / peroxidase multi-domain protein n=1 Tax=Leptospira ryugenii TaxID=1917863 RepID=A0A2P2E3A8_9LEPT|nr:2Fe-2S iron-sulfur cluster-binding domain / adenylate/guanylate cyclase catalytic domain / peroxidase multi-domain protein [Leptospira ryugenii]
MIKCHCAEVYFDQILEEVRLSQRPVLEVAQTMGAAETCTACVKDMLQYIQDHLEEFTLVGNSAHQPSAF